jgi:type IV secretion system protein VirB6
MDFQVFTPLFNKIDTTTATFVTDISSKVIAEITPVVTTGLTLMFIFYGVLIIRGTIEMPVMDFLGRSIRIALITSVALAGGLYQSHIADLIVKMPDDLASALIIGGSQGGESAARLIDQSAAKGLAVAGDAFHKSGFLTDTGVLYGLFGLLIVFVTGVLVAIGGAFILIAKVGLSILAGLGPFFIVALLFQCTQRFFEMWVAQILNYTILVVIFSAIFGLMMDIFSSYIADVELDGVINVSYTLGGAVIMSGAMIVVLLQLPSIATSLAGGVSAGLMSEQRAVRDIAHKAGGPIRGVGRVVRHLRGGSANGKSSSKGGSSGKNTNNNKASGNSKK